MRGTRWLILAAIAAILGGVGLTWRSQQSALHRQAPAKPKSLPLDLNSAAEDWSWVRTMPGQGRPAVEIKAKRVAQSKDNARVELENVELRLYQREGDRYHSVRSAHARFSPEDKSLYSESDVEITLAVPVEGEPRRSLVSIRSSGVRFDSDTGKAVTDRPAEFVFENGHGRAVGAAYDPTTRELHMNSQVELFWNTGGPGGKPMKLECGDLTYREAQSTVWLGPWARLTREGTRIESGPATVDLKDGVIRQITASKAAGTETYPDRQLRYSADGLVVRLSAEGTVEKTEGLGNASLVSTTAGAETTVSADRVDMDFASAGRESVLTRALGSGKGMMLSKPLGTGPALPETRRLRSETIEVKMRPGGRELESVETHAAGTLEFLPNRPVQHSRTLNGERLWITYGARNRVQSFRAVSVQTRTEPTADELRRGRAAALTRSENMQAEFDPKTGQVSKLEQWDNFEYTEGDRRARAARATMEQSENVLLLETAARVWDTSGSTSADHIRLDQRSGEFTANGRVNSSRVPDKKKPGSDMLSGDQPLQAVAAQMISRNRNQQIHYEGKAMLWQGASRIEADRVDIDREKRVLRASGNVRTQFLEQPAAGKKAGPPVFTTVRAAALVYTEQDRLAHYTGGVLLVRPALRVQAQQLRAFLAQSGADSRLERALADGAVDILQSVPDRTRRGSAEHAEYYTGQEKIVLRGGDPQLADSVRGNTRGSELTYFANDDRLLVNGVPDRPAVSRIRRK